MHYLILNYEYRWIRQCGRDHVCVWHRFQLTGAKWLSCKPYIFQQNCHRLSCMCIRVSKTLVNQLRTAISADAAPEKKKLSFSIVKEDLSKWFCTRLSLISKSFIFAAAVLFLIFLSYFIILALKVFFVSKF